MSQLRGYWACIIDFISDQPILYQCGWNTYSWILIFESDVAVAYSNSNQWAGLLLASYQQPMSLSLSYTMLRPRLMSLARQYIGCSYHDIVIGLRCNIIAYSLTTAQSASQGIPQADLTYPLLVSSYESGWKQLARQKQASFNLAVLLHHQISCSSHTVWMNLLNNEPCLAS
jgi:hypothetical protein